MLDVLMSSFERDDTDGGDAERGKGDNTSDTRDGIDELSERRTERLQDLLLVRSGGVAFCERCCEWCAWGSEDCG